MSQQFFVSLPVKDLEKSKAFYTALGFSVNPQFTDEKAAGIAITDTVSLMLMAESFFQTFTTKTIIDAKASCEWSHGLTCDSKEAVIDMVNKAVVAGGKADEFQDYGFMYQGWFDDPDGHNWSVWRMPQAPAA